MALLHPAWDRPCDVCERYVYGEDGNLKRDRVGLPMARPRGVPTPCGTCEKVPAEARRRSLDWRQLRGLAVEMTEQNRRAWAFYRRCRAVGRFPEDDLVAWYAELVRRVEDAADRLPLERLAAAVEGLGGLLRKGK